MGVRAKYIVIKMIKLVKMVTQLTCTCSELTIESLEKRCKICSNLTIKIPEQRH